jgi:hypothetical protein
MDQETRATVYTFADRTCVFYDKDVLRLPSLAGKYKAHGNTALIDATMQAISDLEKTATLYGDHAFLVYVLTDGQENQSRNHYPHDLKARLGRLPDNWTVAALVPDQRGASMAAQYGFLPGNIAVWSTTREGVREVGSTIRQATQGFMQQRAVGIRGSKGIFQASTARVDPTQLKVLDPMQYSMLLIGPDDGGRAIKEYVETQTGGRYVKGQGYYQLTKKEEVQPSKDVLLMDKDGKILYGIDARRMIGIPDGQYAEVIPENHVDYTIFVRSDSVNRKLVANTLLIVRR